MAWSPRRNHLAAVPRFGAIERRPARGGSARGEPAGRPRRTGVRCRSDRAGHRVARAAGHGIAEPLHRHGHRRRFGWPAAACFARWRSGTAGWAASPNGLGARLIDIAQSAVPVHRRQRHLPVAARGVEVARSLRGLMFFRRRYINSKVRDFNWHHVFSLLGANPAVPGRAQRCRDVLSMGQPAGLCRLRGSSTAAARVTGRRTRRRPSRCSSCRRRAAAWRSRARESRCPAAGREGQDRQLADPVVADGRAAPAPSASQPNCSPRPRGRRGRH